MNPVRNAAATGVRRGWMEFKHSLRSPQEQGFYVFMAVFVVGFLYTVRNEPVGDTGLMYPTVAMPSILGAMIAFVMITGPAFSLAMEKEDGTLLRAKAVPHGMLGQVLSHSVYNFVSLAPSMAVVLIPAFFLFDGLVPDGLAGWTTVVWVVALGSLATLPIGLILGSVLRSAQQIGTWGMLPLMALISLSGIFFPIDELWGWLKVVVQLFPLYWLGLGMRSAFLPDSAAALEIGESWRTMQTVLMLLAWISLGLAIAPGVLRRMAERQSGSQVQKARERAAQWVR